MNLSKYHLRCQCHLLAVVFLVFGCVLNGWAASLLSNAGFEFDPAGQNQNLPGWQPYGANSYNETDATIAHSGTNYFKVYQQFTGALNFSGVFQDYISGPGATYSASGWARTSSNDAIVGQNVAWIEVTFRDAAANILALYRTSIITSNGFPKNTWVNLSVTNQYNPNSYLITNTATTLVAPAGTYFLRYQIVFQGDAINSDGSVYFDDLNLSVASGSAYGNWNITWSDEFNGTNINAKIWTYDTGAGGWGNSEQEYYTTNNAFVTNGLLHIVARKEAYNGASYTSARMKSQGLFACQYGRIEWRAQLPEGVGFWPALWLLGTNIAGIGWPGCGEIDVMENNGTNVFMAQASIHSGSDATAVFTFTDGNVTTNFHTYTVDWATNAILFYVDGHLYETQTSWGSSTANAYPFPFNQPFFLLMNLAVGGSYLGYPTPTAINSGTSFPGEMLVDYVRVYNQTAPFNISLTRTNNNVMISWPSNVVAHLQGQINPLTAGLISNWSDLALTSNPIQIAPTNGSAFYRLQSP